MSRVPEIRKYIQYRRNQRLFTTARHVSETYGISQNQVHYIVAYYGLEIDYSQLKTERVRKQDWNRL